MDISTMVLLFMLYIIFVLTFYIYITIRRILRAFATNAQIEECVQRKIKNRAQRVKEFTRMKELACPDLPPDEILKKPSFDTIVTQTSRGDVTEPWLDPSDVLKSALVLKEKASSGGSRVTFAAEGEPRQLTTDDESHQLTEIGSQQITAQPGSRQLTSPTTPTIPEEDETHAETTPLSNKPSITPGPSTAQSTQIKAPSTVSARPSSVNPGASTVQSTGVKPPPA